jgi:hypothetical protein
MRGDARERVAAVGRRLEQLERSGLPGERERSRELVHDLLEAHRLAIARILERVAGTSGGPDLPLRLCDDAEIAAILMLHGLHPLDLQTRVRQTVAALVPRLAAQQADLELLELDACGRVRLRLEHRGQRSASLREQVEEEFARRAADAAELDIDEVVAVTISLERLRRPAPE